jgi:hypothetical protein
MVELVLLHCCEGRGSVRGLGSARGIYQLVIGAPSYYLFLHLI